MRVINYTGGDRTGVLYILFSVKYSNLRAVFLYTLFSNMRKVLFEMPNLISNSAIRGNYISTLCTRVFTCLVNNLTSKI